ncbi:MAG: glycerophosphoryl diester phosphodiesterase membrane domain-containing protein [Terracidiphilus sp.]
METALRPLSLGEILDRTAQLYRTNFVLFAGIFAAYCGIGLVLNLLLIGLQELLKAQQTTAMALITVAAAGLEFLILFLLIGPVIAAISRAVAWVHLGEPATIRGAYASVLPRFGSYLWLMIITAFVIWTPFVLLYAAFFGMLAYYGKGLGNQAVTHATSNPHSLAVIGIASVAFILLLFPVLAYTLLMALRYSLALPACVLENLPARKSIRRSIELSSGARGRIFVLLLLIGVIKIGLVLVTQFFVFVSAFRSHGQLGPGISAISQVISFFTGTFLGPIGATGITLFYYDQRIRKEGFDIEWMMQAAGLTPPAPAVPEPPQAFVTQQTESTHE